MAIRVVHNICIMQDDNIIFSVPQDTLFGYVPNDLWPIITKYYGTNNYFAIGKSDSIYAEYKKAEMDDILLKKFISEYMKNGGVTLLDDISETYMGNFNVGTNKELCRNDHYRYVGDSSVYFINNWDRQKTGHYSARIQYNDETRYPIEDDGRINNLAYTESWGLHAYCLYVCR